MGLVRASEVSTDAFSQKLRRKQPIVLNHVALSVNPLWLDGIEPRALGGQKERQNAHPFAVLSHLLVVLTNPGAHLLAHMPGGMIPDQEPVALALGGQALTTAVQKLGGDRAHGAPGDKTQPHLVSLRPLWGALLPQHTIAGQCFGGRDLPFARAAPPGARDGPHPARRACEAKRSGSTTPHRGRSEEHTSELQSRQYLVCRLL